jgi:ribose transport system permease protein
MSTSTVTRQRRLRLRLPGLANFSAIYLWVIFLVLFGYLQGSLYLSSDTFKLVFAQNSVMAVLALAFLMPLVTDTYDLSIGEVMSLTIVMMNYLTIHTTLPIPVIIVLLIGFGMFVGLVNGLVVVKLRVNSLIATLGMSELLQAFQLKVSNNQQVAAVFPSSLTRAGNGTLFGIPYLAIYMVVIGVIMWFVLEQTPLGRRMMAVGGNRDAARLAGISANRIVWGSLVTSGAVAAIAGVMYTAQVGAYTSDIGSQYLFPALAAVFFGASQLSQRPNVWGTLIAFFALAFGIQGLTLQFGAGTFWVNPLFQGTALIIAVAIASTRGAVGNGRDGARFRRVLRRRGGGQPPPAAELTDAEPAVSGAPPPNDPGAVRAGQLVRHEPLSQP